jgi:hypothetical protein
VSIWAVKTSVVLMYLQIFRFLDWMRITYIAGIVFITLYHLSICIAFAAMCAPQGGTSQYDFFVALISEKCVRGHDIVVFQGVGNVAIDLLLLVFPLPAIWRMQMPLRRKLATSAMFSIGLW